MAGTPPQQHQSAGAGRGRGMTVPAWMKGPSSASAPTSGPAQVHLSGSASASGPSPPPRMPGLGPSGVPPNFGCVSPMQFRAAGPPPPFTPSGGQQYRPPGPLPGMGPQLGVPGGMQGMVAQSMAPSSQPQPYSPSPMQQMPPRPPQQSHPQSSQGMAIPYTQQSRPMSTGPPQQQQHSVPQGPGSIGIPPQSSFGAPTPFGMVSAHYQNSMQPPTVQSLQPASQPWPVVATQNKVPLPLQGMHTVAPTQPVLGTASTVPAVAAPLRVVVSDWQEHTAPDGRRYFHNKRTKLSSWEKPTELMSPTERADASTVWKEFTAGDGRKYYYNKVTKQSKWTMPEEMKAAREQVENPLAGISSAPSSEMLSPSILPASSAGVSAATSMLPAVLPPKATMVVSSNAPTPLFGASPVVTPSLQSVFVMPANVPTLTNTTGALLQIAIASERSKDGIIVNDAKEDADWTPALDLEEARKAMPFTGKVNVTPVLEERPSPTVEEPVTYASKTEAKNAFKELLEFVRVECDWTWDQAMRIIINDKRYGALKTLGERKQAFNEYLAQRRKLETEEKRLKQKKAREDFTFMLEESKELTSSMRWSKAVALFEDDIRFITVEKDREREELFEDFLVDLERKERERAREERKKSLAEYRVFLESCEFIKANSQWRKIQDKLEDDDRCARLDKIDRLDVFQEYIRDLEKEEEEERKSQKEQLRRRERKNRDDFRHLMDEHKASGVLNARTLWRDYLLKVKDHAAYQAVASNNTGSTPRELFDDFAEELEKQYHEEKGKVKDAVKVGKIVVASTWSLEKFKGAMGEAGDLGSIAEPNLKLIFEDLLERAKDKDEKETKKRRRLAEDFTNLLRSIKSITAASNWGDSRVVLQDSSEYRAISEDTFRRKVFEDYVNHLQQRAKEKEWKREKEDKAKKDREKEKEKERERRKEKEREREKEKVKEKVKGKEKLKREKEKEKEKGLFSDVSEAGNNHVKEEKKKEKEKEKEKDREKEKEKDRERDKDKKHRKRHRSSSEDLMSGKEDKEEPKRSRRHGSDYRKPSKKHGHNSGSDSEAKHRRHRRERDGSKRNGVAEELEDGELGEDGEIQ